MALTLRSSTSFLNLKDSKGLKTPDDVSPGTVCFAQAKAHRRLRAMPMATAAMTKGSTQEPQQEVASRIDQGKDMRTSWSSGDERETLHALSGGHQVGSGSDTRVPVFVMLPLDTVGLGGSLNKPRAMNASLMALKSAGVEGVMVDAWWGLVEKDGPLKYNWDRYAELVQMVQRHGLTLQVVMSFHQCGGNVGDSCR